MPTGPLCTALANPSATPSMIAVPQSAPMNSSPRSSACRLSWASTPRLTPSEKQNTCRPAASAAAASCATCSPGIERNARLSSGSRRAAEASERAAGRATAADGAPPLVASSRSTAATTASTSSARTAITRSLGPTSSSIVKPWSASSSRLSGVAMPTDAPAACETSISVTES